MTDHTRTIWEKAETIAVMGLSTNDTKAAHAVPAFPQAVGFRVIPVHHSAVEILSERAYRSVTDIDEPVDVVNVFRPAAEAPELARQAVAIGAKVAFYGITKARQVSST